MIRNSYVLDFTHGIFSIIPKWLVGMNHIIYHSKGIEIAHLFVLKVISNSKWFEINLKNTKYEGNVIREIDFNMARL